MANKAVREQNALSERVLCPDCQRESDKQLIVQEQYLCPYCGHHFPVGAYFRLNSVLDDGSMKELDEDLTADDPLQFPDYPKKLEAARLKSGLNEAVVTAVGAIGGYKCVVGVMDSRFMMGSMGTVVGEKITRAVEYASSHRLPLILFCASGGTRMQEGILSLMQMAKTSAAISRFSEKGLLYISVLTHPTTGGVTASFASLGDIILAEPGALIGFAGQRVIEDTIHQKLPEGFQRAEFQQSHGFVDQVVPRNQMRQTLTRLLALHQKESTGDRDQRRGGLFGSSLGALSVRVVNAVGDGKSQNSQTQSAASGRRRSSLSGEEKLLIARHWKRPGVQDYIDGLFTEFFECRGDRQSREDMSILGGIALYHGVPVTVIGTRKGKTLEEKMKCNFGMPGPEGYRKALQLMKQAEKFHRPVITFIDTTGAYPGIEAEEKGQGEAIARNLMEMSSLQVPVISVVTGEGNSGGALALGVADRVLMQENSVYAILSPEGFASILWKDSSRSGEACDAMKMTAQDLLELGVIDEIVPEPEGGAHEDPEKAVAMLEETLYPQFTSLIRQSGSRLAESRYQKFRKMGRP
ncbi:MAG: acetyl-CoA carboxylase carboxyltransferase subunit alpha [Lachnospiraceae bacterium]|nr:acetyl-CoA carboxylase carboxyltransferase subunit alpha [Lachnospiraceae bacterium]